MGVMVMMAIMLAAAAIYVELKLVKSIPGLGKIVERFGLVGLALSIGLSVLLGGLFGAAGVIIMVAGMASTAITVPIYRAKNWYTTRSSTVKTAMAETKATYRPIWLGIKWTAIILTSPFWVPVVLRKKFGKPVTA